jgi:uncharacterized protein (TIGR03067 family)
MKARFPLIFAAIAVAFPLLAAAPEPTPTGDLALLQGEWKATAGSKKEIAVTLTVKGRDARVDIKLPQGVTIQAKGEISLHEGERPRGLDWVRFTALDGQDMPEVLAIYELDGDTLRVCNGGPNNNRPKEFKRGDGALADVVVFRREKVETAANKSE